MVKHVIIGTAGHVDHGKTTLIQALTGINTDRLPEEKRRGLTIETGFAHLLLGVVDGVRVEADVADVPGHERFIANMLVGASQTDVAIMVVAADDGVMPQTREHLTILQLLGIAHGVVALTRCDLASAEQLAQTYAELTNCIAGSFLEGAAVVEVSAPTGKGIEKLKEALLAEALLVPQRNKNAPAYLPIDRVFTISGFGTVVTGALQRGTLHIGDTIVAKPIERAVRIRGLQCNGEAVEIAYAGQRVAVNLSGIGHEELSRRNSLQANNLPCFGPILCVKLKCLSQQNRVIMHNSRVHLFAQGGEVLCRVFAENRKNIKPNDEALVQLVPERPFFIPPKSKFVVRFYSPIETVGGGEVLYTDSRRYSARDHAAWSFLHAMNGESTEEKLIALCNMQLCPPSQQYASERLSLDTAEIVAACKNLEQLNRLTCHNGTLLTQKQLAALHEREACTTDNTETALCAELCTVLEACEYLPLTEQEAALQTGCKLRNCAAALNALAVEGRAKNLGAAGWILNTYYRAAEVALHRAIQNEPFTLAQYRDILGASRKPCQLLLEHFDTIGATKRVGDMRYGAIHEK